MQDKIQGGMEDKMQGSGGWYPELTQTQTTRLKRLRVFGWRPRCKAVHTCMAHSHAHRTAPWVTHLSDELLARASPSLARFWCLFVTRCKSREILMFVCLQKDDKQCCDVVKLDCTHSSGHFASNMSMWRHVVVWRHFVGKQTSKSRETYIGTYDRL